MITSPIQNEEAILLLYINRCQKTGWSFNDCFYTDLQFTTAFMETKVLTTSGPGWHVYSWKLVQYLWFKWQYWNEQLFRIHNSYILSAIKQQRCWDLPAVNKQTPTFCASFFLTNMTKKKFCFHCSNHIKQADVGKQMKQRFKVWAFLHFNHAKNKAVTSRRF